MIGNLRQRLVIEEAITATDEGGGMTRTWQSLTLNPAVWAKITPLSADKKPVARHAEHQATHRITLRHRPDLLPGMRFRKGLRIFTITALLESDDKMRFIEALTRETTP